MDRETTDLHSGGKTFVWSMTSDTTTSSLPRINNVVFTLKKKKKNLEIRGYIHFWKFFSRTIIILDKFLHIAYVTIGKYSWYNFIREIKGIQ